MEDFNNFKVEVLTQLAVINSKLDDYNKTQDVATEANTRSKQNEADIKDMKDTNKWAFRTSVGAVITSIIAIIFYFIKNGAGIN